MMQEPVEQRGDGGGVAEELSPLVDRTVGGEHRGGPLVTAHDELEQVLGGGVGQLAHAEVVDDEQVRAGELGEVVLAGVGERRLGEFFEEGVRFAVEDAVALLDRGASDGLGEMTLPGTGLADQEDVLALCDEARGGEFEDECAVDLLVKSKVETVERAVGVSESGLLVSPCEEAVLAALELVGDERGEQVDGGELLGLGLEQARFEDVGHAGEAQLAQRLVYFDEIHAGSPVLRSIRSR